MRVLFTSALVAALASAGSAPAPTGNTAKRNVDPELAPHRFDSTKTLIAAGTTDAPVDGNTGGGQLELRVVLQADDNDRARQELHTDLKLSGIELTSGQELYMGWAMRPSSAADLSTVTPDCAADTVCAAADTDKLDEQGTSREELVKRAGGAYGWDGVSYMKVYDGTDSEGGWIAQEIWVEGTDAPDLATNGIGALTVSQPNAFVVDDALTSMTGTGASVYSDRVWDSLDSGNGYAITDKERAFDFIGWYYVYDATPCAERLLQDGEFEPEDFEEITPKDWATVCPTTIMGQSEDPQIFVLGALNGLAVASVAILTSMLF